MKDRITIVFVKRCLYNTVVIFISFSDFTVLEKKDRLRYNKNIKMRREAIERWS